MMILALALLAIVVLGGAITYAILGFFEGYHR